jgi:hypothetical protein
VGATEDDLVTTRDLTVLEVITFAMQLRCRNTEALEVVSENVSRTISVLYVISVS